jgi:acetyl esterase/lipase
MIIHGGAWQGGSPRDHAEFSRYMAARGYVVWAITYRYAPKHKFPAQIEDVQTALQFIQQHGQEYETDLNRVALMGRSAGAHLTMLAAYDTPKPNAPPIRAVVNYYGPVDLTAGYYDVPNPDPINSRSILQDFLGGTPDQVGELYKAASPITYVHRRIDRPTQNGLPPTGLRQSPLPPSLLIYGGKDHIVMAKFGKALAQRLIESGNQSIFLEIPWADHSFDAVFSGISNQLALYYTERFLAVALANTKSKKG